MLNKKVHPISVDFSATVPLLRREARSRSFPSRALTSARDRHASNFGVIHLIPSCFRKSIRGPGWFLLAIIASVASGQDLLAHQKSNLSIAVKDTSGNAITNVILQSL